MQLSGFIIGGIGGAVAVGGTIWQTRVRQRNKAIKADEDKVLTVGDLNSERASKALAGLGAAILVFGAMLTNGRSAVWLVPGSVATLGMTYLAFVNPTDLKAQIATKSITFGVTIISALSFANNLARRTGISVDAASITTLVGLVLMTALPYQADIRGLYSKYMGKGDDPPTDS